MAEELLVRDRARLAEDVGRVLAAEGLPIQATYWDYIDETGDWNLRVALSQPVGAREFFSKIVDIHRKGLFPDDIDFGDIRSSEVNDPRAAALVHLKAVSSQAKVHVKSTLLDRCYFEEAVLGYVSPDFLTTRTAA